MNNFDIAEQALQTSLNSSGSAMREHEKWQQSLEAQINRLKAAWQGLSQAFMSSDFLKVVLDGVIALVDGLTKLIDTLGTLGTIGLGAGIFSMFKNKGAWSGVLNGLSTFVSTAAQAMLSSGKLSGKLGALGTAAGQAGKSIAGVFTSSLSGAIGVIGIAVAAIGLAVNAYKKVKEEAAAARQEVIESSDAYLDAASSFEQAYIKYSDKTSLTAEEEAELESAIHGAVDALGDKSSALQSAVNSSDNYITSLEAIKNAELKAAEEIAQAKKKAAEETLKEAAIGWESFDGSEVNLKLGSGEASKIASKMDSEFVNSEKIGRFDKNETVTLRLSGEADTKEIIEYYNFLKDYQAELESAGLDDTSEYKEVKKTIDGMTESIGLYTDGVYDAAKAQYQLTNGIPKTVEEYLKMREAILKDEQLSEHSLAQKMAIANTLDSEYGQMFNLATNEIQSKKLIGVLDKFGNQEALQMEAFLDMRTAVNKEECSVGDYISQFENINKMTEGWSDEAKEELKLSFGLDTDTIKKQYDDLLGELPDKIGDKTSKEFLNSLSASELSAVYSLKGEIDWVNGSPEEILAEIEEQARLNEAMTFTINIETQIAGVEALNTALGESRSAMGLTSESIEALKSRYSDLDGFNAAALFEETAGGVRLNNEELARLESQYENFNKLNIDSNLNTLVTGYKEVTEEIKNCTDAQEKETLQAQANTYADKIQELSMLASQYDGLTSAFNKWQNALSSANDGDNYDSLYDNLEAMKELRDSGLVGTDDFKTAAQLMTNKDLSNAGVDEIVSAFDKGYPKMQRYFTEGQKGCQNFLKDLNKMNSEWAHMNKDGSWEINFNAEEVAKKLGASVDSVLLIANKLRDYGFEINLEDNSLDNLQTKIEQTEAKLKELGQSPVDINVDIEANSENLGTIETEIEKAKSKINEINNSSIEPNVKTAQLEDAQAKLEALIDKKIKASQPAFMSLDTSQVNASLVEALEKIQAYQNAINDLNKLLELKEAGIVIDDSQITSAQQKADECVKAIQGLEGEVKVAIGLEEDGSIESIKKAFEEGKVKIDANTDPALTKIDLLAENVEHIEDKDVTINVVVNGLDDVKELNKQINLATDIDGDIDKLSEYVESAKALNELDDNILSYITANVKGNVIETAEYKLDNLKVFVDSAKGIKDVGSFTSNIEANVKGNVIETSEDKIDNLKVFSESAKDVEKIGNVESKVVANIEGNVTDKFEYQIDNLKTFSDNAKEIKNVGNVEANVRANVEGNVTDKFEYELDNLKVFTDNAKDVQKIGNVESKVTANIDGNVTDKFEYQIDNLKVFTDSAKDIKSIGTIESKVTADVEGNVVDKFEYKLDNLKVFTDNAKDIKDIGVVESKVTANIEGNVVDTREGKIDNLKAFTDSAENIKDIGIVESKVTANVEGNVIDEFEYKLDNLKVFVDSAKDIGKIGNVTSEVVANVEGNIVDTFEYKIDNLKVYSDSAKDIKNIGTVDSNVTANVDGNVIDEFEYKIDNLKIFADSAKDIKSIGNVDSKVTANVDGNVIDTREGKLDNLKVYTDSAKNIKGIGEVASKVTADVYGNVIDTRENKIDNLKVYTDSAKKVEDIGEVTSKVTANIYGNVIDTREGKIDNLKVYTDSAKKVEDIGTVKSSVTADVDGNVIDTREGKLDNLKVFGESAKKVKGIGTVKSDVTANINGNVINTTEEKIDNLGVFADNANKLKDTGNFTSSVAANVSGNIITDDTVISDLEHFVSITSGMVNQTVTVSVTANVASEKINEAIDLLSRVSQSGVFKDYNATVQVGATIATIDDTVVQNYKAPKKDGKVSYSVDENSPVYTWTAPKKYGVVNYSAEVEALTDAQKHKTGTITYKASVEGAPVVNGTANVNGTAFVNGTNGRAYKQGNWGAKNTEVALTGELGQELIVYKNRYWTVGDNGAEFATVPKGAIVFNHKQTEELFKNGKVTSDGGRGRALAEGNAFVSGGGSFYGSSTSKKKKEDTTVEETDSWVLTTTKNSDGSTTKHYELKPSFYGKSSWDDVKSSVSSGSSSSSSVADEFEETFDWIEVAVDRIERAIDRLDRTAGNVYASWSDRNEALLDQISTIEEEITLQQDAYERYMQEAESIGLDESWAKLVREGAIDITTITDTVNALTSSADEASDSTNKWWESFKSSIKGTTNNVSDIVNNVSKLVNSRSNSRNKTPNSSSIFYSPSKSSSSDEKSEGELLAEKIKEYQDWYEKALDCQDAIEELKQKEAELYAQRVENVAAQYEGILGVIEHKKNMLEEYINQSETQAWLVSENYYKALVNNEKENLEELENQKAEMIDAFNEAMESGTIAEGSEGYYDLVSQIDEVTLAIAESETQLLEYQQTIQQLKWETFDLLHEKISAITEETEFLIELMSSDKLFDDNGRLTDEGKATMGLHGQNYNTYMYQADQVAIEAERLKKELEKDPYDTELEERYREMIALQQEYILSAQDEKEAIRDLVSEGIEYELEALQELIDKKNEQLQSEKDLYEYSKKVKEQTKEIASLEKQMTAYSGDNSEEAQQKIQQIKVELESAKEELQETEYDKFISDSATLLDELYLEYETLLNTRLDNLDYLVEQMIAEINADAVNISETISAKADEVGYTLSDSMKTIWDENTVSSNAVITTYGDKFLNAQTTTHTALNLINTNLQNMINQLNSIANTKTKSASKSSAAKSSSTKKPVTKKTTTTKSGGDGKPKIGDRVKYVSGQYYYDSQGKKPLGSHKQGEYVYITNINEKDWATHGYHISTGNKLGKGDLGWLKLNQLSGYATGKKNFSNNEVAWTQENGQEYIVRPSDGAILTPIAKGDSVLTSVASGNIWNMANNPADFIKKNLESAYDVVPTNSNIQSNYTQHFDEIVFSFPNVKNYDEMLSAMQKDKNFERLVDSMTIGKLAGKSGLAKGKSIR